MAYREALLEAVRAQQFLHLPSRLRCVFCFARREDALFFQRENVGFCHHILHRVGLSDNGVAAHEADWHWINTETIPFAFPLLDWAFHYWQGTPYNLNGAEEVRVSPGADAPVGTEMAVGIGKGREVLIGGPVTVEEAFDLT